MLEHTTPPASEMSFNAYVPLGNSQVSLHSKSLNDFLDSLSKLGFRAPAGEVKDTAAPEIKATPAPVKAKPKVEAPAPAAQTAAPAAAPAPIPVAKSTIEYATLQKEVFKLVGIVTGAKLDPQQYVLDIARTHGGANFQALAADQWDSAFAAVQARLKEMPTIIAQQAETAVA